MLRIEPIGVYRHPDLSEIIREYCEGDPYLSPEEGEREARELLEGLFIVELVIHDDDGSFNIAILSQDSAILDSSQIPYDEKLLSDDGASLIDDHWELPSPLPARARIAFFMHDFRPGEPLHTPIGPVALPDPVPAPERLLRIMPYHLP